MNITDFFEFGSDVNNKNNIIERLEQDTDIELEEILSNIFLFFKIYENAAKSTDDDGRLIKGRIKEKAHILL